VSVATATLLPTRWRSADGVHFVLRAASLVSILVALGVLVQRAQTEMLPIALAGLALGPLAIAALFRGPERRFLLTLFLAAFAARLLVAVLADPYLVTITRNKQGQVTGRWVGFLFEDDRAYHKVAYGLVRYWLGVEGGIERSDEYLLRLYTYMVAWLYQYAIWAKGTWVLELQNFEAGSLLVMAPKLLNAFIGAVTIAPMFALGRELGGERAGRLVALAGAFWPSLLLWSVINLKDVLVVGLIASIMFFALRFARRPSLLVAGALLVAFAALENLRLYVFYAFGWLVPISFFLVNRLPWRRRLAVGGALWAAVLVVMLGMNQGNQWLGFRYLTDKRFEALDSSRRFGADTAESGIELPDRISRYEGGYVTQLRNIPIVMPYVLWAPFPWKATRPRELVIVPEMLAWYAVEALVLLALVALGRGRWRELFLPVAFAGGLVVVFSIIEGNVGTIYRHRSMLFPTAFSVASIGLLWLQARWAARSSPTPAPSRAPAEAVA